MNSTVKTLLWAVVVGAVAFAGFKAYKLYKAKQAAKVAQ